MYIREKITGARVIIGVWVQSNIRLKLSPPLSSRAFCIPDAQPQTFIVYSLVFKVVKLNIYIA